MDLSNYYTFKKKILINLVTGGMNLVYVVIMSALMKFYTDVIGLSPATYGVVFLIFSIWNGINDPIIGYWADKRPFLNVKGKYAPLIRWAIPVIGVAIFSILCASPSWGEIFTAAYLLILLVIYEGFKALLDVSFTSFKINTFLSMKERTQVQVIGTYMSQIPVFLGGMIPVWFLTGEFSRFTIVAIFSAAITFGLVIAWIGSRFIKEDAAFYEHMETAKGGKDFLKLFLELVKNKSFLIFVAALILINTATGNYFIGYLYYMDNVLEVEGLKATIPDVLTGVAQMLTMPLIVMAVKKYGSKNVYATGMLIAVAGHAVLTLPINYWVASATYIVILIGYGFSSSLLSPLQGIVIDDIELKTGKRQPGTVSGMMSVFMTIAASIQPLLLSVLLTNAGYVGAVKQQTPEVVRAIRVGTGIIPALILLMGIIIFYTLPINRKRELEIQAEIEAIHTANNNFVGESFLVPETHTTGGFVFKKLTPEYTTIDFTAVMESREHIRELFGVTDPGEWPAVDLTMEKDRSDLEKHEQEFNRRAAFAYTVLSPDETLCLGCIYIDPSDAPGFDAVVTMWTRTKDEDIQLYKVVKEWLDNDWEFGNIAFPVFEMPLSKWRELCKKK